MAAYCLRQREIPCDDSWDVIVIGGGPAGCTAATASAREGARTLLVEATGCLGGMGTSGLVPAWCPFSDHEKIIYRGLAQRVFEEAKKGVPHFKPEHLDWVAINPEQLKRIYDDMVTEAGVTVLFCTMLSSVEMEEDGQVSAILLTNKAGLTAYKAKVYVDCTGDADLVAWAGGDFKKGDDADGSVQDSTHCFILSNVDDYAYQYGTSIYSADDLNAPGQQIYHDDKYPDVVDLHMCQILIGPSTVGFNAGHLLDVDNTDPMNLSRAMMKGRKIALQIRNGLAEYFPKAFANSFLVTTGSLMGIRETRRIVGDYCLTIKDYVARQSFPDEICRNSYYIDCHVRIGDESKLGGDLAGAVNVESYGPGESHGIPYRCLVPKNLQNVLVAGRSISCDRPVQGSVRVMPVCLATGEAAGLAAALAAKSDANTHNVDTNILRMRLKEEGVYLP